MIILKAPKEQIEDLRTCLNMLMFMENQLILMVKNITEGGDENKYWKLLKPYERELLSDITDHPIPDIM